MDAAQQAAALFRLFEAPHYFRRAGKGQAFEIDPGKLADEARYDGVFVLRTDARVTPLQAVLRF